jgi:hypothetical protein
MSRRPPRISYQAIADEVESYHENDSSSSSSSSSPSPSSSSIRIPEYQQLNHHEELLFLSTKNKDWLLANSPRGNPRLWNVINGTALVASLWLLIALTYLQEDGLLDDADKNEYYDYRLVPFYYAVYNLTTTIIWCIEDGLCLYYECRMMLLSSSSSQRDRNIGMMMLVHAILLVAALYFLVTSIIFFFGDKMAAFSSTSSSLTSAPRDDEDELMEQRIIMDQITRDVFTSCLIYLVALLYVCLRETTTTTETRRGHQQQKQGGEQGGDCCFPVVCNDRGPKRSYQTIA